MTYAGDFECRREDSSGTTETRPKRERQQEGARCGVVDHIDGASRDLEIGERRPAGASRRRMRLWRRHAPLVRTGAASRCVRCARRCIARGNGFIRTVFILFAWTLFSLDTTLLSSILCFSSYSSLCHFLQLKRDSFFYVFSIALFFQFSENVARNVARGPNCSDMYWILFFAYWLILAVIKAMSPLLYVPN